jgi:arginine decarboxylase
MMPITHLDKKATRSATLWDITCDSDGEILFDESKPLYLHDVNLKEDNYFIAFFNVGAYQDILGMRHNLFSHPTEVTITKSKDGIRYDNLIKSQKIIDIFEDLASDPHYKPLYK